MTIQIQKQFDNLEDGIQNMIDVQSMIMVSGCQQIPKLVLK